MANRIAPLPSTLLAMRERALEALFAASEKDDDAWCVKTYNPYKGFEIYPFLDGGPGELEEDFDARRRRHLEEVDLAAEAAREAYWAAKEWAELIGALPQDD